VHAQFDRVVAALAERFPDAAEHLDACGCPKRRALPLTWCFAPDGAAA
jgi:hypothetical protein